MKLTELIDLVLVDSGQFIVGDLSDLCLDKAKFWTLVKTVLITYERHRPYKWHETINVTKSHTFTEQVDDDQLPVEDQVVIKYIPEWISEVLPVGVGNVYNNQFVIDQALTGVSSGSDVREPMRWVWKYAKPTLYIPYTGRIDILCVGKYVRIEEFATGGGLKEVEIVGLSEDKMFLDLVTGKFMQAVGRSRRAFTLDDLPVTTDSAELVSEGKEIYDQAYEKLEQRNDWSLAIGN